MAIAAPQDTMRRTTIMLPPELKEQAARRAARLGISLGELIREAVRGFLESPSPASSLDPLYADDATWDGPSPADMSTRADDYLYGESP